MKLPNKFPESELIVNPDGRIYHLNLHPDELADTVITVGDPERVKSVSKLFDKVEVIRKHREFVTHTGRIGKKRVSVVSTGIGTDNIDIVFNELDALVNINLKTREAKKQLTALKIIRIGTAGCLQGDLGVDCFVASTYGVGTDNLLHFYKRRKSSAEAQLEQEFVKKIKVNAYAAQGDMALLQLFRQKTIQGITVTCPGFYAPQGRVLRYDLQHPDFIDSLTAFKFKNNVITNFEMETAGIYGMGRLLGHHCLSLSLIVANRINKQFSKNYPAKMKELISTVVDKIEAV